MFRFCGFLYIPHFSFLKYFLGMQEPIRLGCLRQGGYHAQHPTGEHPPPGSLVPKGGCWLRADQLGTDVKPSELPLLCAERSSQATWKSSLVRLFASLFCKAALLHSALANLSVL